MAVVSNTATAVAATHALKDRAAGKYAQSTVQFLRPANTSIYAALDVISDSTSTAASLRFPNCSTNGAIRSVAITHRLETDTITPRLWIFDAAPTDFLDNAALALVTADCPKIVTYFDFVDADKLLVGTLINHYTLTDQSDNATGSRTISPVPYTATNGFLYGLLQTVSGYTPISATEWTIKLGLELL